MSNQYRILKSRHQKEINEFPMFFAFYPAQVLSGMQRLGLESSDYSKVIALGFGSFCRKSDAPAFYEMIERHKREVAEAIEADEDGCGFIYDMFSYELADHDYSWTENPSEAIRALGLTREDIENSPKMQWALSQAMENQHFL